MAINRTTPPSGRIGSSKSRSGCKTCKIRRVKCGEEKPSCLRCTSTGRKCDFENNAIGTSPPTPSMPTSLIPSPSHTLSSSPNSGRRERRAFGYYFQHAAQYLSGGMDIDFWTGVAPQICRTEPAVWDAIIAISALFEYPEQCLDFTFLRHKQKDAHLLKQSQKEALVWYSRSISSIHSQIERGSADPYIALISCVLFICVETIQGRMEEALQLLRQGMSLILDLRVKALHGTVSASKAALLENTIIPLFLRLNTIALTISGTQPSELFSFENNKYDGFSSLGSARQSITTLGAECILFQRDAGVHLQAFGGDVCVSQDLFIKQQELQDRLARWKKAYTDLCQSLRHKSPIPLEYSIYTEPTLLAYHAAASVYVAGSLTKHETVYDDYLDDFRVIVEQSSLTLDASKKPNGAQPPFTFEMGVGLPLFVAAAKCRHPGLRRRALQLLRRAPPVQGFYKCPPVTALAEHLMQVEEGHSIVLNKAVGQDAAAEIAAIVASQQGPLSGNHVNETIPLSLIIPEEARICDTGVFRLRDGLPYDVCEDDVMKWNPGPEQLFMTLRRLRRDPVTTSWEVYCDCIPMNF
ncbi:uncharacterized protein N7446_010408 [Penicillium canescens]|uniref:Zn(2)-C6 fungal-type domain-containing protein n=1 Tax=Penicillium canescens TaxID=5083 RepID=A0AAD6N7J2_PENCN|nr:uncharacterized protein N7446_010408 [Penicillium canescens]KAJ6035647.1 hypothetical protein N7460_009822 [Penicillium canescens]KAJ6037769.1 hypothetical protein N7444_010474 [Penicillium canescens]KAJ6054396.1 hypothetical protein N7446_010408 [Penicillium canescens]